MTTLPVLLTPSSNEIKLPGEPLRVMEERVFRIFLIGLDREDNMKPLQARGHYLVYFSLMDRCLKRSTSKAF